MQSKKIDIKILILLLIMIIIIITMFFLVQNQKKLMSQLGNIKNIEERVNAVKLNDKKMDKLLINSNELLRRDQGFLDNLKSYIALPKTESDYDVFIGEVKNKYPFGNPIQGEGTTQ